jgi:REP element-mobilizing transposase RayT
MARPLRIEYGGAIHHVTVRGNARQNIFLDDRDRRILLNRLAGSVQSYGVRIYLYCLMDNHFHLVLETPRANLRRFMQSVLTGFTVSFNLLHRRCGHVTQGRYGARLVAGDDYLLKLSRYVHLNPVKVVRWSKRPLAERISRLRTYAWSSYREYVGREERKEWMSYEPMLELVSPGRGGREVRYERFVEKGIAETDEEFRDELERSPRSIGDAKFREWVDEQHTALLGKGHLEEDVMFRQERMYLKPEVVLRHVAGAWKVEVKDLALRRHGGMAKGAAAHLLEKHAGLSRRACASWIGVRNGSGVAYQIRQALEGMKKDPVFARQMDKLERELSKEEAS